jgi:hypothetical protein
MTVYILTMPRNVGLRRWRDAAKLVARGHTMDQISTKTPVSKCRLYWCLIEFIDWRYSQPYSYFRPLLIFVNLRPSNLLTGSPTYPPSALPCVSVSTGVCIHTVCSGRGKGEDRRPHTDKHLPPSTFIGTFLRKDDI